MSIYTYVVEHVHSPRIHANQEINGGKLKAVMFDDALLRLEEVEKFLAELREKTSCHQTKYSIDDFVN